MAEPKRVVEHQHLLCLASTLANHIHACNAEIHTAVAHADYNVAGSLKQHRQPRQRADAGGILAGIWFHNLKAAGRQET
jgi:hypothetical protein